MSGYLPVFDGFPISEIARICQVSLKTARRWKQGTICPPAHAILLLRGDLGAMDSAWAGWMVRGGKIVSPDGREAVPGDVLAIPFMRMQIQNYQLEFRQLKMSYFEEQPPPESWAHMVTALQEAVGDSH